MTTYRNLFLMVNLRQSRRIVHHSVESEIEKVREGGGGGKIYVYIYRERESEREGEIETVRDSHCSNSNSSSYSKRITVCRAQRRY